MTKKMSINNRVNDIVEKYGINKGQAFLLLASQKGFNSKLVLSDKVKNLDSIKGKDDKETELLRNNQMLKNQKALNELYAISTEYTLIANELNTGLLNLVGGVYINDGLDVFDRYSIFEKTSSEFGQLDAIYGLDILEIADWSGDWAADAMNPQFVKNNLTALDTKDKIRISYRNNSSVYGGAFLENGERINYLAAEAKKALDTQIVYFNEIYASDLEANVKISVAIPGFDNELLTAQSVDIINETLLDMKNENTSYNEAGFTRATSKENLVLIAGKKYFAKTRRDLSISFNKDEIDNKLGIANKILENKLSEEDNVIICANTFYNKNSRVDQMFSNVQIETGNTVNYHHIFKRRAVATDQQAVLFSVTTVPLTVKKIDIKDKDIHFNYSLEKQADINFQIIQNKKVIANKFLKDVNKNISIFETIKIPENIKIENILFRIIDSKKGLIIFQKKLI